MKVFIGFDERQPIAFQVCAHSIWERASKPVEIIRLDIRQLPIKRRGLTAFTYSRFLVPYLCGFEGSALFLDSDMLVRADVHELHNILMNGMAVVKSERKFEWPSVMFFVNGFFKHVTPEFVEREKMFDFKWVKPEPTALPKEWNHLVGYDPPNPDAKIVHFTMGIPVWPQTKGCEFSDEWWACCNRMNSTVSFQDLMGRSVHLPHIAALK